MLIGITRCLLAIVFYIQLLPECCAYASQEFVTDPGEGDVVDIHVWKDSGDIFLEFGDELEGCELSSRVSLLLRDLQVRLRACNWKLLYGVNLLF